MKNEPNQSIVIFDTTLRDGEQAPFHSTPSEILMLHRRFPKLKIAAAHLGGFGMWDEVEETLIGEDVFLDLSHTFF